VLLNRPPGQPAFSGVLRRDRNDLRIYFDTAATKEWLAQVKGIIACDTEAEGLGAAMFALKCVTFSGGATSVILDPRDPEQAECIRLVISEVEGLVMHNSAFDAPTLINNGLMRIEDIDKVQDTLIYARLGSPSPLERRGLGALAQLHLGIRDTPIKHAMKAAGFDTISAGFAGMDISSMVYCNGAMEDTRATLALLPILKDKAKTAIEYVSSGPWASWAAEDPDYLVERDQIVNRVMLHAGARGLEFDGDYYDQWKTRHEDTVSAAADKITALGLDPGNGQHLVEYLHDQEALPKDWPRTETGLLGARAADVEKLVHPAAVAHLEYKRLTKVNGYLQKCASMASVTGRVHTMAGILGASATGRMSYGSPELQQFPGDARGVLRADAGDSLVSIDWSAIEPITLANISGEWEMIQAYESGAELYAPAMTAAGVQRKIAKVVLLAGMYGQGADLLAKNLSDAKGVHTGRGEAKQIQSSVMDSMPNIQRTLTTIRKIANTHGYVVAIDGRPLPIPKFEGKFAGYKGQNFVIQSSAYTQLAESIVAGSKAGLSGTLRLAMHDELVVDRDSAEEWRRIMETPCAALCRATDRVPVLRTDMLDMGTNWMKPE